MCFVIPWYYLILVKFKGIYMGLLTVSEGQVTFNAEGNDIESSLYFSRVIHWPGNEGSGVTIGRGYDMGSREKASIYKDMIAAGVITSDATLLSNGASLKGTRAKKFVENQKNTIGKITHLQQVKLFKNIYPAYITRAKNNYNKWTNRFGNERTQWDNLDQPIRDILVDFVYQGFTRGANPMAAGMNNDYDELISYISQNPTMQLYEAGRHRVQYLQDRRR